MVVGDNNTDDGIESDTEEVVVRLGDSGAVVEELNNMEPAIDTEVVGVREDDAVEIVEEANE